MGWDRRFYDRDTGIFYDASVTERNALAGQDIHDLIIVCGTQYIDGEWRTVYEIICQQRYGVNFWRIFV